MISSFTKSTETAAQQLRVRSALNPMLWLTGIASPICFTTAYAFREYTTISIVLVVIGLLPIIVTCVGFGYFAIREPEKLQSEDYQLRHEALQMIQQKTGHLDIDPTSLVAITNPALPALPPPKEGNE